MPYLINYFKIYLWRIVGFILNLLSIFIVIPFLSSNPAIYGIYSFCISISIFFTYGDLGFLRSSQKFAAECYSKNDTNTEYQHIGFSLFVLTVFILAISIMLIICSFNPHLLLKNISQNSDVIIASKLLFITGLFSFQYIFQRGIEVVYSIRIKDYLYVRINIFINLLKICSVYVFFNNGTYNITGYYLVIQLLSILSILFSILIAKKKLNFDFYQLIRNIRFNRKIFDVEKKLAISVFYVSFMWILYYEIDTFIIGKFIDINQVAIYSIAFIFLTFFRNIFSIIFSPFFSRMNHFLGQKEEKKLETFILNIVKLSLPLVIISTVAVSLYSKQLILTWVGPEYEKSINIATFLILCNILAFISYPVSNYLLTYQRIKDIYITSSIMPIIYWLGIVLTYHKLGLQSFGVFKLFAFTLTGLVYFKIIQKDFQLSIYLSIKYVIKNIFFSLSFLLISQYFIKKYLPTDLSSINVFLNVLTILLVILISLLIYYFSSKETRKMSKLIFYTITNKNIGL